MKKHIVCFGDSNTHGYCAETNGRFDEEQRWTCLLQKYLGDDFLVLEEGLSGRTTSFPDPIHEGLSGQQILASQVGGENDDGVLEIHRPALTICILAL